MNQPIIGLLPFYLKLYDDMIPNAHPQMVAFYQTIAAELRRRGLVVMTGPLCRIRPEFAAVVRSFEKARVDAIVTLHLAYSPSLESAAVLAHTTLPIVVLDTTPALAFGPDQDPDQIMYNHGIHGVQDMCNLLVRNRKSFQIEAGHWQTSDVLDRVVRRVQSARIASALRRARVGRIGLSFASMGDFAVPTDVLRRTLGVVTVPARVAAIRRLVAGISRRHIDAEIAAQRRQFSLKKVTADAYRRSVKVSLAVRRWLESEKLSAFTVNFLAVTRASGLPTMPFLEAGLAMGRGIGYAGEGDVLTAALVGALATQFPDTTFTEMFCPDWKGNRIFLSHMGEVNVRLLAGRPELAVMPFRFTDVEPPVRAVGCLRGGPAVFINLAPLPGNQYRLIIAPVMMQAIRGRGRLAGSIRGWFRPRLPVSDFLAAYSRAGGTHHAALVYGDAVQVVAGFGELMGWETVVIK